MVYKNDIAVYIEEEEDCHSPFQIYVSQSTQDIINYSDFKISTNIL